MYHLTRERALAVEDAARCAGAFLNALGKVNLSTMTQDEWMSFITTVCVEYDNSYENRTDAEDRAGEAEVNKWVSPPKTKAGTWSPAFDLDDEIPF
jgi:hypothetical protein